MPKQSKKTANILSAGTLVIVTNEKSAYHNCVGTVHTPGCHTGYYVKFDDGVHFVPYGVEECQNQIT